MQEKQMKNRDQRTRLMSELLANIKRCRGADFYTLNDSTQETCTSQYQIVRLGKRIYQEDSLCEE